MDVSSLPEQWWYTHPPTEPYTEWRPQSHGEVYNHPGEPSDHFYERLSSLVSHLSSLPQSHVVCVSSWGVIRELAGREDIGNCEVVEVEMGEAEERVMKRVREVEEEGKGDC